jgi:hypothetical protein
MTIKDLLQDGDPFDDPLWKAAEKAARAPRRRRNETHIGCPMWWLAWVFPLARSSEQLVVALYLYRLRVVRRSKTITVSNRNLERDLGINRYTKYRALTKLEQAGVLTIEQRDGRAVKVTLLR